MKFLHCANLSYLNSLLDEADSGDCVLSTRLECYTCRGTRTDKRLSHQIETRLTEEAQFQWACSPDLGPAEPLELVTSLSLDSSPGLDASHLTHGLGKSNPLRTYTHLVLCLNHCYNHEFDFSCIPSEDFQQDESLSSIKSDINSILVKFSSETKSFPQLEEEFWNAVNDTISTPECEFYIYKPEEGEDPIQELEQAALWSKHFFFYNKKLKKVLLLRCWAQSKSMSRGDYDGESDSEEVPNMTDIDFQFTSRPELEGSDNDELML
jgi:hypothetical protein|eukprot:CAMPEP_0174305876 /NCGR_PEP_ID=MMETSP0810-20121108/88_1 /TAXON_ID=73025 ORGANISM="Eutreptiella gymnastica-like, Strain CCMP1594" /NCGR_SAMPLE_ID=MMETSP0810 /ASSEMBLY_ACC=CAM_ASM_000659 /LENGTH=265 /DNA_ID=CAMNT_0015412427 /DNA_START=27 /DNA_END=824 /DNA_ORIENTATION=-